MHAQNMQASGHTICNLMLYIYALTYCLICGPTSNSDYMGGGAGPAGQVLAGPLFCPINYSQNERRFLGLNLLLRNHRW